MAELPTFANAITGRRRIVEMHTSASTPKNHPRHQTPPDSSTAC
jgi:hypothetical protein